MLSVATLWRRVAHLALLTSTPHQPYCSLLTTVPLGIFAAALHCVHLATPCHTTSPFDVLQKVSIGSEVGTLHKPQVISVTDDLAYADVFLSGECAERSTAWH